MVSWRPDHDLDHVSVHVHSREHSYITFMCLATSLQVADNQATRFGVQCECQYRGVPPYWLGTVITAGGCVHYGVRQDERLVIM